MIYLWILNILIVFLSLFLLAYFTYYFQIKEYRVDRVISAIKENGLILERFTLPKKSVRNFNIVKITLATVFLYEIFALLLRNQTALFVILILLIPVLTLAAFVVGVVITERISTKNRNIVIKQAIEKRKQSTATFIGVTGSFGKSTTKEFIYSVLSEFFVTGKTIGNYNTSIGVAISINEELKNDTQYFVTEMGAYKSGEIKEIAEYIKPKYSVITGLGNQHLSLFGSHEGLVKTKAELIESTDENGTVYINADSPAHIEILKYCNKRKIVLYSTDKKDVDIYLDTYKTENGTCNGKIKYGENIFDFETKLTGQHFLSNMLPAVAIATDLGVPKEKILVAISKLENAHGKLSIHKGKNGITYFYDGYSSNVAGFESALEILSTYDGNKFVVTKGIIELGREKEKSYSEVVDLLKQKNITLLTTDKLFKKINPNVVLLKNENQCAAYIKSNVKAGETVLIEGRFSDNFTKALGI